MFGPKKGPPKPVPPKRRGAPARKPKPTKEEEEAQRQQKYLDELGECVEGKTLLFSVNVMVPG